MLLQSLKKYLGAKINILFITELAFTFNFTKINSSILHLNNTIFFVCQHCLTPLSVFLQKVGCVHMALWLPPWNETKQHDAAKQHYCWKHCIKPPYKTCYLCRLDLNIEWLTIHLFTVWFLGWVLFLVLL